MRNPIVRLPGIAGGHRGLFFRRKPPRSTLPLSPKPSIASPHNTLVGYIAPRAGIADRQSACSRRLSLSR